MSFPALVVVTDTITKSLGTAASVTKLGAVQGIIAGVPLRFLLWGHCLAAAGSTRGRFASPLLSYTMGFLAAFGGGMLSGYFLGMPTSNVLFQSDAPIVIWSLSWWLMNHLRFSLVGAALDSNAVSTVARACAQVLRSGQIVGRVNTAVQLFPSLVAPALIAGTLAGSGGKIVTDFVANAIGFKSPFEVASPSYVLRSSAVASCLYYFTVHMLRALSPVEGHSMVLLAFLMHTLSNDLYGAAYDYTQPVLQVFYMITFTAGAAPPPEKSPTPSVAPAPTAPAPVPVAAGRTRPQRRKAA